MSSLVHLLRHPRSLLPGAPSGVINSARDWVSARVRDVPVDIRRGPAAAVWEMDPCQLTSLPAANRLSAAPVLPALRVFPVPATALFFLRGARVLGSEAAVISADNRVFAEFTYVDAMGGIDSHSIFKRRRFPKAIPLAGWYATLSYPSAFAYYHWIVESLPRLRLLEPHLDALTGVFVPANLTESMKQSLYALGLRADQLLPMEIGSHYAPEHLLVPAYCAGLDIPQWVPAYLRSRILGDEPIEKTRRIYLSRGRVGKRRILNEDELLPILKRHDFEVLHPQDLSFREQARAFAAAECIVGPSGAALANVVFASAGAKVVVLQPHPKMGPHVFYSLASAARAAYWELHGVPGPHGGGDALEHCDFKINADDFDRMILDVMGSGIL